MLYINVIYYFITKFLPKSVTSVSLNKKCQLRLSKTISASKEAYYRKEMETRKKRWRYGELLEYFQLVFKIKSRHLASREYKFQWLHTCNSQKDLKLIKEYGFEFDKTTIEIEW